MLIYVYVDNYYTWNGQYIDQKVIFCICRHLLYI